MSTRFVKTEICGTTQFIEPQTRSRVLLIGGSGPPVLDVRVDVTLIRLTTQSRYVRPRCTTKGADRLGPSNELWNWYNRGPKDWSRRSEVATSKCLKPIRSKL